MTLLSRINKEKLCVGCIILACSVVICSAFSFWLYKDTDLEKYVDYLSEHRRLHLYERYDDASELRSETLAKLTDAELDPIWLSVVQGEPNGLWKLELYLRLLAGDPDREESYKEITAIINSSTEEYKINKKPRYLRALKKVTGVHDDLLEKYGLLTLENEN